MPCLLSKQDCLGLTCHEISLTPHPPGALWQVTKIVLWIQESTGSQFCLMRQQNCRLIVIGNNSSVLGNDTPKVSQAEVEHGGFVEE